jgi:hypothetical protein
VKIPETGGEVMPSHTYNMDNDKPKHRKSCLFAEGLKSSFMACPSTRITVGREHTVTHDSSHEPPCGTRKPMPGKAVIGPSFYDWRTIPLGVVLAS